MAGDAIVLLLSVVCCTPCSDAKTAQVVLNGQTFSIPAGWTIERVATHPLVDRPIVADFDAEGFLYVADSSGSNAPPSEQLKNPDHRIVRLEDADGDGRFERGTVFADRMMFPEGALFYRGSLYVAAPPHIWRLTDENGDGVADRREIWLDGQTLTGCANDLHGPYLGRDGWIYWCKGAFAEQVWDQGSRPPLVTRAAHVFRRRPEGGPIEPVLTGGMDNPVELVFTPNGERIITTTFLQTPGGGRRDGLIHAVYGGVYGKENSVVDSHPRTSPLLMPVLDHLGPAAPSGLAILESELAYAPYRGHLLSALFNLHKVVRHELVREGATFSTRDTDLVASDSLDFHPTDVLEDADGSILILDTGGWYKLCCPTSQLSKPDVLGSIYRLRRTSARRVDDPRGKRLDWQTPVKQLAKFARDPRHMVRSRLWEKLSESSEGIELLSHLLHDESDARLRAEMLWALGRAGNPPWNGSGAPQKVEATLPDVKPHVRRLLGDPDETVRQSAAHLSGLVKDRDALPGLVSLLNSPSAGNRRAAAEALGRLGDSAAIPSLLAALQSGPSDPVLEHSLTYALIDIGDASPIVPALDAVVPRVRAGALMAIEAIDAKRLQPELVARWLEEPDPGLRSRASFVALKHPEWGSEFVEAFEARLARAAGLSDEGKTELVSQLARFAGRPAIVSLLGQVLVRSGEPAARELTLKAIGRANLKHTPHEWIAPLVAILEGQEESTIQLAVSALRGQTDSRDDSIVQALRSTANRADFPLALRIESLSAIGASVGSLDTASFELLRDQIDLDRPVSIRSQAVDVLAKAQLDDSQRIALAACVRQAGPLELDRLLGAFSQGIPPGAEQTLLDSIGGAPGFTSLTPEILRERLAKIAPSRKPDVETLIQSLTRNQAQRHEKMEKLLSSLGEGDLRRGQAVFHGTKAACFSCHAIGYRGGNVGPDLTRIGAIRSERDLLEAIVEPSSSFVRSYEPWIVATGSGTIHTGLIKDEGADEVVLATSADEVVRIPRGDVEELRPGTVSLMPSGFDQQLTPQDLADLIAFLKAAK